MRMAEDGNGKSGVAGNPEDLLPGVSSDETRVVISDVGDEDLFAATEDPAWSLKESGSAG